MASGQGEIWVDEPPEFEIKDGIGRISIVSGDKQISLRCTPHVLLAGSSRAMRAYVEWDAQRTEFIPIRNEGD